MFEWAGIIRAGPFIPLDTVSLWNVPSLLTHSRSCAGRRGTEGPGNSFTIGLESLPIQVAANCCH